MNPDLINAARTLARTFTKLQKSKDYRKNPALTKWRKLAKQLCNYPPQSRPLDGLLFYRIREIAAMDPRATDQTN